MLGSQYFADVAVTVDVHGRQAGRKDVIAGLGEPHLRP
jgi:hypothetical protein